MRPLCADLGSACPELRTLRLGLSGIRSLALALPSLTALDLNRAGELRCLELRCPALLVALVQGCRWDTGRTPMGLLKPQTWCSSCASRVF